MLLSIYFIMAFSVSCYIYKMVLDSGLSDKELMGVILDEDTTKYIEKHPKRWKWVLASSIMCVGLAWPITLYWIIEDYINNNK